MCAVGCRLVLNEMKPNKPAPNFIKMVIIKMINSAMILKLVMCRVAQIAARSAHLIPSHRRGRARVGVKSSLGVKASVGESKCGKPHW